MDSLQRLYVEKNIINMDVRLLLICLFIWCSCDRKAGSNYTCKTIIGELLFDVSEIEWGEVRVGKDYEKVVRIYNPTHKDVSIKVFTRTPELRKIEFGGDSVNMIGKEFILPALTYDSLCFTFVPCDTSLIGDYSEGIFFEMNGALYMKPIEMKATVLENFDSFSPKELLSAPIMEVERDSFSFGTIRTSEKARISIKITNRGEKQLIIRKVETDCTCTAAVIGNRIVGHGDSVFIEIVFNPMGRNGKQYKTIKLFSNDPQHPMMKLMIHGFVDAN